MSVIATLSRLPHLLPLVLSVSGLGIVQIPTLTLPSWPPGRSQVLWCMSLVFPAVTGFWPWELDSMLNLCVSFLMDDMERVATVPKLGRCCDAQLR